MRAVPRLLSLVQAAMLLGPHASVKQLRREVRSGRLKAYRLRPGPNAKILVSECDLMAWLENVAGNRQRAFQAGDKRSDDGGSSNV